MTYSGAAALRAAVETRDAEAGIAALADDVVFNSPIVFKPYHGRDAVGVILEAALATFEDFRYLRVIADGAWHVLMFEARVGDRQLEGVDIVHEGPDGHIDDFTVMVRPMSGMLTFAEAMRARLEAAAG